LSEQLAGLREALTSMSVGEKRRLWLPYKLAFGSKPTIMNAPKSELVYDVALLKIISPPTPPQNVAAAPPDAKRTPSGLAYRVVDSGTGTRHPGPNSRVSLRFAAFTPDGKMFESSYERGDVTTARLTRLIKGWQEGLQLMVEGERTVFWIPGSLAHGEIKPGVEREPFAPPAGPVVFDVELVEILEP
jgi:peptidylprolyl isomerase